MEDSLSASRLQIGNEDTGHERTRPVMLFGLQALHILSLEVLRNWPSFPYHVLTLIVIVAPTAGYVDTVRLMIVSHSAAAYNINIAMILNSAQGLKILYYIYHRYAFSIFGQCFSYLTVSMTLTFLKFKYSSDEATTSIDSARDGAAKQRVPDFAHFGHILNIWKSETFLEFMVTFGIYSVITYILFVLSMFVLGEKISVDGVGLTANVIESLVSIPMFVKIVVRRQIDSVSVVLVLQYITGDLAKLGMFALTMSPWPFFFGAFCQLAMDTVLSLTFLRLKFAKVPPQSDLGDMVALTGSSVRFEQERQESVLDNGS
jgi:hypothetical protein